MSSTAGPSSEIIVPSSLAHEQEFTILQTTYGKSLEYVPYSSKIRIKIEKAFIMLDLSGYWSKSESPVCLGAVGPQEQNITAKIVHFIDAFPRNGLKRPEQAWVGDIIMVWKKIAEEADARADKPHFGQFLPSALESTQPPENKEKEAEQENKPPGKERKVVKLPVMGTFSVTKDKAADKLLAVKDADKEKQEGSVEVKELEDKKADKKAKKKEKRNNKNKNRNRKKNQKEKQQVVNLIRDYPSYFSGSAS